jgi:tight adherence protein B
MFDFNPVYLMYLLIGVSAAMFAEGVYLLFYNKASYRHNINRRLKVMDDKPDRESVLVQLRRERGLTSGGEYRLPLVNFNKLVLQSGLTIGFGRLILIVVVGMIGAFAATMMLEGRLLHAVIAALFSGFVLPFMVLRFLRSRRQKKFVAQFPDAIDIIYGADLESAMRNLYFRVGTDDLPLFVTAVAIQGSTGGNLGEILENLSGVIRQRFKMRRKIHALAAEGRASALILSSLPIGMFAVINFLVPTFYASVWGEDLTKIALVLAACWMGVGNFIMYRMVNFKI